MLTGNISAATSRGGELNTCRAVSRAKDLQACQRVYHTQAGSHTRMQEVHKLPQPNEPMPYYPSSTVAAH